MEAGFANLSFNGGRRAAGVAENKTAATGSV
jgi:hypothetical protein